jgi:hypothetical protein
MPSGSSTTMAEWTYVLRTPNTTDLPTLLEAAMLFSRRVSLI